MLGAPPAEPQGRQGPAPRARTAPSGQRHRRAPAPTGDEAARGEGASALARAARDDRARMAAEHLSWLMMQAAAAAAAAARAATTHWIDCGDPTLNAASVGLADSPPRPVSRSTSCGSPRSADADTDAGGAARGEAFECPLCSPPRRRPPGGGPAAPGPSSPAPAAGGTAAPRRRRSLLCCLPLPQRVAADAAPAQPRRRRGLCCLPRPFRSRSGVAPAPAEAQEADAAAPAGSPARASFLLPEGRRGPGALPAICGWGGDSPTEVTSNPQSELYSESGWVDHVLQDHADCQQSSGWVVCPLCGTRTVCLALHVHARHAAPAELAGTHLRPRATSPWGRVHRLCLPIIPDVLEEAGAGPLAAAELITEHLRCADALWRKHRGVPGGPHLVLPYCSLCGTEVRPADGVALMPFCDHAWHIRCVDSLCDAAGSPPDAEGSPASRRSRDSIPCEYCAAELFPQR
eukprot:TRINITY_DN27031_c0_g4_i1.p1 TRINITY_DN27031_c0_g4~~TRINITY_DN27031_c0_g4_i1.p1  ORF type:complete len:490 (+),score=77.77 TRINITY_DN27031_c0_g4_i1:90-1472(+)